MRPAVHFTPAAGWINDPHAISWREGRYEVFFQFVPGRTTWAPHTHWGHASGPDLLTLTERGSAIAPGEGDDGIWTGSLLTHGEDTQAFYTSVSVPEVGIGRVRVATPEDSTWDTWAKGPVVAEAPADLDLVAFRDPFVRREGEGWRMFVGAAGRDGTAMALTYVSKDRVVWNYDGVALARASSEREPTWTGALWECPQVVELDGNAAMISSVWDADVLHYAAYALGSYSGGRFDAHGWARLTWGPSLYAPTLFTDADDRPALTFWLRGIQAAGWAGAHSVAYRLEFVSGHLVAAPHPDVAAHRSLRHPDGVVPGLAADVEWDAEAGALSIESGGQVTVILEREGQEMRARAHTTDERFPVSGGVRVIVDGPILEVSSAAGLFAVPIAPAGGGLRLSASVGELTVFGLA
ncbi:MAG: glycoside hydrolase family 32 protein [Arachnia sp.]